MISGRTEWMSFLNVSLRGREGYIEKVICECGYEVWMKVYSHFKG